MRSRQHASLDCFVIKVGSAKGKVARQRLGDVGAVDDLAGTDLLLLRVKQASCDGRATWERIRERIDCTQWAAPVLVDDRGQPHYPSGSISVRFERALSDAELEEFASRCGLRVCGRNEFVAEQATFEPLRPHQTYLPELIDSILHEKGVVLAWPNTLSRYTRR
jgi:hypothetical protein